MRWEWLTIELSMPVEICFYELGAKNLELIKEMALWATVLTFTGFGR